jgi:outer membrane protein
MQATYRYCSGKEYHKDKKLTGDKLIIKRMKMKMLLTGILGIAMAIQVNAQKQWTLEECIQYALDHNIQIKRQELITKTGKNNFTQSRMEMLPSVNAGVDYNLGSGRILNTDVYKWENTSITQGSAGIQADLNLFNGLQTLNTMSQRKYDLMTYLADYEVAKNDLMLNIATGYLQILFDQELVQVAQSQLEVTQLQLEKMRKLVEVGNKAMGDLLQIQAQAASDKVNLTSAANKLKISKLTLAQYIYLENVDNFDIVIPENMEVQMAVQVSPVDSVFALAATYMPEIRSAEYQLKSKEKALAATWGRLSPSLSLQGLYYSRYNNMSVDPLNPTGDYPLSTQLKDNQYKQVTLNLSIPIFNKWRTKTQIDNARIAVMDAQKNLSQTNQVLYKIIQQATADATNAYDKYLGALEAVKSNEESFKYVEQKFNVGIVSSVEFNVEKNNLSKARADLVQAKYEYIFKTKILDFYTGVPIKL